MKKWIALVSLLMLLLLSGIAAGPFLVMQAIAEAVRTQDTARLSRHVDFAPLRASLKLQIDDYLVRRAGPDVQSSLFGAIAVRIASGVAAGSVDAMVTPAGIAGILQGRSLWHRVSGAGIRKDSNAHAPPSDPLEDAQYGFESSSRFTATVHDETGQPVVLVLTRKGVRWKLSDIRLPLVVAETVADDSGVSKPR